MEVTESSATTSKVQVNATQSQIAQKTWEISNFMQDINSMDELYKYDEIAHRQLLADKPWDKDPHYFKHTRVSALALLKMVIHARSGGNLEIMGLLLGKVDGQTMVVMDSFALPVEGTETRVNAHVQGMSKLLSYFYFDVVIKRLENPNITLSW